MQNMSMYGEKKSKDREISAIERKSKTKKRKKNFIE